MNAATTNSVASAQSVTRSGEVIPRLGESHTVLAPDLLGHGESSKPQGDYSLGAYANAVRDLLEALELPGGTIVGHSLGGGVAMQLAYQYPERCERLVLVSSGGLGRELHAMLRAAALPGAGVVLPWLCVAGRHSVGRMVHAIGSLGLRASADLEETWRSFVSLEEPGARQAFLRTVRGLIDLQGQRHQAKPQRHRKRARRRDDQIHAPANEEVRLLLVSNLIHKTSSTTAL